MRYSGIVIRPPSEAGSLILQVTLGCSHNKCTFCPTYKDKRFSIRSLEDVLTDIEEFKGSKRIKRVFLADGDALIIPQKRLLPIMNALNDSLPALERIGVYGNTKSVLRKTRVELEELKNSGLGIIYLGLESGSSNILTRIKKGVGPDEMIDAAKRVKDAGILLSVTVILGLGGENGGKQHAEETGRVLTKMDPDFIGALTLMLVESTHLYEEFRKGEFRLPDPLGMLEELGVIIENTDVTNSFFTSNHASNYLPLRIRLPEEKENALSLIRHVLDDRRTDLLRPEHMRGL